MKIRTGFVSNSSTSSFCIYGTGFDLDEIKALQRDEEDEDFEEYDVIHEHAKKFGLQVEHVDYDSWYVGLSWDSIGEDETGRQFKQRVKDLVQEFGANPDNVRTIEMAWRDG